MAKFVDVTLRLIDEMTGPLKTATATLAAQSAQISKMGRNIQRTGRAISSAGASMTAAITLPAAALGTAAVKNYASFDANMTLVNSTMANTEKQAKDLTAAIRKAASNSTYSMEEAGQATLSFARAGLNAAEAAQAITPAMNAAAGEGGDLNMVANGLVSTIRGFGGTFDQTTRYADVFAAACNNSQLDINSLSEAMSIAAPIFHAAGYEIEDASLYMGIMANNGIEASVAANSLKTGFAKLVSPAKEGQVWLDRLGVSITNADGSMKDSLTVQKDLHNAFATLSESEQMAAASAIFGKNQMAPWLALINTGTDDVNKLNSAIAGSNGLAQKMADDMMGGFAGSLKRLSSSWDVFLNTLGEKLAPYIGKVVNILQKATDALNGMSDEQFDALIKIVAGFAALGPALVVIGKVTTGIGTMVSAVGKIGKAMKGVSSIGGFLAKLVGPGGWIALIIAAVVLIGVMVWKNWDKIKPIFEQVKTAIQPIIETIKEVAMSIFTSLQPAFEKIGNIISQNIGPITEQFKALLNSFMPVFQIIAQGVADLITVLGPVVSYLLQQLGPAISAIINLILLVVQNVLEKLLPLVQPIMQVLTGLIEFITGVFTGDWQAAWQGVVDIFSGIFNGIKSICKSVINGVIKSINGVLKGINGISIPDWVPGVGGASLSIPLIPQLAKGTNNWAGGVAQISERGGEIVDLPSGSRVYPHDETVKMAYQDGANTGKTVNVSIPKIADTIVVREDADIDKIVNKLAKQLTEAAASLGSASLNSAGKATPTLAAANTM